VAGRRKSLTYLDTHVVAWLYDALLDQLSAPAKQAIEQSTTLLASPMVRLELQYLREIGRIREEPERMMAELRERIDLRESEPNLAGVVTAATSLHWTRDTFDRLIVAECRLADAGLVTKDRLIRAQFPQAIW
jgi:PIN domain nuclease of toxin-antitoxin system